MNTPFWSAVRRALPGARPTRARTRKPYLEALESRLVPSAAGVAAPDFHAAPLAAAATAVYTPAQVRGAYGFSNLSYDLAKKAVVSGPTSDPNVPLDGAGQTIAVVDAFDDPNIFSDLNTFDGAFGLPAASLTKTVVKTPQESAPGSDPTWAGETSLDVEWVHAIAPKAKILLVEAASDTYADLLSAVGYAAKQPGVTAVSMSWGGAEFSGETAYDSTFAAPAGHAGVVFVASSGDSGAAAGAQWPAVAPTVLAVGGTSLSVTSSNAYGSETAWGSGGGGKSLYETEPSYQWSAEGTGKREAPDVAYNADPNKGVYVYDSLPNGSGQTGWFSYGGTSAGAPQWAALIALADQGRAQAGLGPLANGPAALYSLTAADFHDITAGGNGDSAATGYDLATGRGSPRANLVIADLVNYGAPAPNKAPTTTKTTTPAAAKTATHAALPGAPAVAPAGPGRAPAASPLDLHAGRRPEEEFNALD